jgi:hypothetical protein
MVSARLWTLSLLVFVTGLPAVASAAEASAPRDQAAGAPTAKASPAETSPYRIDDAPRRVYFSIYLLDVDEIRGDEQSFVVNVVVRLRWKDVRLAHEGTRARTMPLTDVWEGTLMCKQQQSRFRPTMPNDVDVEPDGTIIFRQQWSGPLSQPLSLADFPLDAQDFNIDFLATGYRGGEIEFVPDIVPGAEHLVGGGLAETLSQPDWEILSVKTEARPLRFERGLEVPGFGLTFMAKRRFAYYLWNVMMPLWLIVIMSWTPFWVDPDRAEVQIGAASGTVLALIAQRIVVTNVLPRLPYLTRMDYLTLGTMVMVFVAFIQVIATSILNYKKHRSLALKIDHVSRWLFPIAFILLQAWAMLL